MLVWSLGQEDLLKEGMATLENQFAWKIAWIEEPGRLPSMGLQRVGHDQSDLASMHSWYKMLVSTIQQSESVICVYISRLF